MAIKLIGNYAKRLGLPGYSSHQFSVSVETELTDTGNIQDEATRIYHLLQDVVDREIQEPGFVPTDEYGHNHNGSAAADGGSNGTRNYRINGSNNGNGAHQNTPNGHRDHWSCSDKQKELILKLVDESDLDREAVQQIALDRFSVGVRQLNKLQASGLIDELLEISSKNGKSRNGKGGRS